MTTPNHIPQIDLPGIIRAKNPTLARLLPGFILRYLNRIIHVEEINRFLREYHTKRNFDFINQVLDYIPVNVEAVGLENIPQSGGAIVASNHPLGGPDALALMQQIAKVRRDQKFLVNDILMNLTQLSDLFVPVNKHGRNGREVIRLIDETYSSEHLTLIFPAGLVSRKQNGRIEDLVWHKSFINQAIKYQRPVIPVLIQAQNSSFFYNLALWRKRLGIGANIEMLYLVDELYKQKGNTIRIIIGEAISPAIFTRDKKPQDWAALVKQHVYALGKGQKVLPIR